MESRRPHRRHVELRTCEFKQSSVPTLNGELDMLKDSRKFMVEDLEVEIGFDLERGVAAAYIVRQSAERKPLTVAEVVEMLKNADKWNRLREALITVSGASG